MLKKVDLKDPAVFSVITTFIAGIMIHMFGLVNVLQNHDNIAVQPIGHGTSLTSGRWGLYLIGRVLQPTLGEYNLPWPNGILFILIIAVTIGMIISLLEIKHRKSAVMIGIIFIGFPSATATLMFRYTAPHYAFAILLAVAAVWFLQKCRLGIIPAALCIAFSLGIYQAYIPITISICILLLIKQVLQEDVPVSQIIRHGIYDCAALLLGLILYFLILKLFLFLTHQVLGSYQGINDMGNMSFSQFPSLIWKAFCGTFLFPINGYGSLAQKRILKYAYFILQPISATMLAYIAVRKKKGLLHILLLVLLCLVFPIAINFIAIMCPNSDIYTLMVYAFALIPCVPLVLIEILPETNGLLQKIQRIVVGFSVFIILLISGLNAYMANANYMTSYYATRQTENYMNSMVTQIRLTKGFTPEKKWAVIGTPNNPMFYGTWDELPVYGGIKYSRELTSCYSWQLWIRLYCGCDPSWANEDEIVLLSDNENVKNMPTWPSEGSIKVIDDYVVIKFEDTK